MVSVAGVCYTLLNIFLLIVCFVYIGVRFVFSALIWCIKTPFYFCIGVKNFIITGTATSKEEPKPDPGEGGPEDFESLFAPKRRAPAGPKRDDGQGFIEELPKTTEDAIKRLLSHVKSDAYTVLGVAADCAQPDIKKTYRQQAILVHPDKTTHPGADTAFKILVQAFETVGDPDKREEYDAGLITPEQFAADIDTMMKKLYEMYSNTLPCAGCNHIHKITPIPDKQLTRYCEECREYHPVKDNDIWAETKYMGFYISYFACRNSVVYNVSDWIMCQNLKIVPNTHVIQCALRKQTKTFDDILEEWKNDPTGKNKHKQNRENNQQQQQQQTPQSSTKSRRSRKKRKK